MLWCAMQQKVMVGTQNVQSNVQTLPLVKIITVKKETYCLELGFNLNIALIYSLIN